MTAIIRKFTTIDERAIGDTSKNIEWKDHCFKILKKLVDLSKKKNKAFFVLFFTFPNHKGIKRTNACKWIINRWSMSILSKEQFIEFIIKVIQQRQKG